VVKPAAEDRVLKLLLEDPNSVFICDILIAPLLCNAI
jgi:hypothetical protein